MTKTAVLFVCLGNICRSPVAEAVFRQKARAAGHDDITIDSAGTAAWHQGKAPDTRMMVAARQRGYDLSDLRARQVRRDDFHKFDFILAMDRDNFEDLQMLDPDTGKAQLEMFLDCAKAYKGQDVPDPYFGEEEGFDHVIDLVEMASEGLLKRLLG